MACIIIQIRYIHVLENITPYNDVKNINHNKTLSNEKYHDFLYKPRVMKHDGQ